MEERTIRVRSIPEPVMYRVEQRFEGQPDRGQKSPEQGWWRINMCIDALDPSWVGAVHDLWECALVIARSRWGTGTGNLRSAPAVYGLLAQERVQFEEAFASYQRHDIPFVRLVGRLSGVLYRSVQAYIQDYDILALETTVNYACQKCSLPPRVALRCAVKKMEHRAMRAARGEAADKLGEEQVMLWELEQFSLISGSALPPS